MNSTPSQLTMHYGACPKKLEARFQTIVRTYREHYHKDSIPKRSEYWTICGRCSYEIGKIEENCEPDQLIKYGLIKEHQFFGVEIDPTIYEFNKAANQKMNWLYGDFYEQMVLNSNYFPFRPAIVNSDMLLMPKCGVEYFSKIMHFLTTTAKEVMLVGNFILKTRQHVSTVEDIVKGLEKEPCFQDSMNTGLWTMHDKIYLYNGTGNKRSKMGTVVFFKKEK